MSERPPPPPEGALITAALKAAGISVRAAARRVGISDGRWGQITRGYQNVSAGQYAPVRGPALTVAKMANVAGVTPQELEEAGRADAAEKLREIQSAAVIPDGASRLAVEIRKLQEQIDALMAKLPPERREQLERLLAEEEQEIQRMRQDRLRRLSELFQITTHEPDESP
ncbi:hypothetical protein AB0O28_19245 [Microbispora sp. NPDC088329]|uniref:hypothetical protein n=1 Tax=Microbispora sp. NPDC088329 TaxID=3154869 RepID=UPI00343FAC2F